MRVLVDVGGGVLKVGVVVGDIVLFLLGNWCVSVCMYVYLS
jgi:hypothetical protein